jgi:N-acetylmuramoyl-L-alanine amidase
VVIDAGHGGHDQGTTGPTGLLEKDLVLDISMKLGAMIQDRLGSEVVYTRTTDVFVPLEDRTAMANQHRADLFISIHANSSPYKSISGAEVFYLNFTTSKDALEVAARENAAHGKSIFELSELIQKIALKDKVDESREFASRLQTNLHGTWSKLNAAARNRGVKKAPFVVLIGASMPSVLAEIGFLSNPKDEQTLRKPEARMKVAEALFKGVEQYASSLSEMRVAQTAGGAPSSR